ncbi:hypothetical protein BS17DRAFT_787635 [Gyrodon lividus]|nr:hypothetical protein BS17DRAFT_787635 [Gyrodon lividus]
MTANTAPTNAATNNVRNSPILKAKIPDPFPSHLVAAITSPDSIPPIPEHASTPVVAFAVDVACTLRINTLPGPILASSPAPAPIPLVISGSTSNAFEIPVVGGSVSSSGAIFCDVA